MILQSKYELRVPFWVPSSFVFKNIIKNLFQKKNIDVISQYLLLCPGFCVFYHFYQYRRMSHFHLQVNQRIFYDHENILIKSMASRLSNAYSNASIAILVPEKVAFELVKLTQQSPFQSVFTCIKLNYCNQIQQF